MYLNRIDISIKYNVLVLYFYITKNRNLLCEYLKFQ